ncbi:Uma2 family endonuclease [Leptolyngbya boryana CZ1]|uniref:Uma2 family endonuclease n=1 Tax=Leptolyngbya boryana CZ1 TaxID=3060204 RepID=A0AA96X3S0_LEPBY|nr:Uma2 family endonuclease [Leptolyngbya boryana]WNZ44990.1 Uma2 family endonuclease [Leptolyngbya boryana CZ1]
MTLTIPIKAIQLAPGSTVSIHNVSWQDFETLLADLGEKRNTRIAYYQGTLEIMSPLARHERPHRIIAHILTVILELRGVTGKILVPQPLNVLKSLALSLILVFTFKMLTESKAVLTSI